MMEMLLSGVSHISEPLLGGGGAAVVAAFAAVIPLTS
jgi:hypothetical protein